MILIHVFQFQTTSNLPKDCSRQTRLHPFTSIPGRFASSASATAQVSQDGEKSFNSLKWQPPPGRWESSRWADLKLRRDLTLEQEIAEVWRPLKDVEGLWNMLEDSYCLSER